MTYAVKNIHVSLFQRPGRTEKEFEEDAGLVQADLDTLKSHYGAMRLI